MMSSSRTNSSGYWKLGDIQRNAERKPNKGVQATANSVHSCLAPAVRPPRRGQLSSRPLGVQRPKEIVRSEMVKQMSMQEFLETQPLYTKTDVVIPTSVSGLFPEVLLLHCGICNNTRPFRYPFSRGSGAGLPPEQVVHARIYHCHFACTGCQNESFSCWVKISLTPETWAQKVGQYPSVADLHSAKIKRYRKVLSPEDYRELNRAVGLAAHGVGIGAFVYLRRIFERLIEEARQIARHDSEWDEALFLRSRMPEKIVLLASHLPSFLVKTNPFTAYSVKGSMISPKSNACSSSQSHS
jgi:hypothetical protein